MTRFGLVLLGWLLASVAFAQQEIPLWPAGHAANHGASAASSEPVPDRIVIHHQPSMLVYLPKHDATGAAVMICPGGGYGRLAMDHEGWQVAEWFNDRGIAAFVLKYRCGGGKNGHPAPLNDAVRGMKLIRSLAGDWNIEPEKVGVIGFSAGGHLASSVSTLVDEGDAGSSDPIARLSSRPAFSVLIYPVITMQQDATHSGSRRNLLGASPDDAMVEKLSTDRQVSALTPPTFIAHASDDKGVLPENAIRYYRALIEHDVPAELHLYERGGHGFGMRTLENKVNDWLGDLDAWLRVHGLAPPKSDAQ